MKAPRYDVRDLMAAGGYTTTRDLAEALAIPVRTVRNRAKRGLLEHDADEWACACDLHAEMVWPDWGKVPCADPDCDVLFTPLRSDQKYHDPDCRRRRNNSEYQRRRYYADPDWAARKRATTAAYQAENARAIAIADAARRERDREIIAARQRAYYRRNRERLLAKQAERDRARRGKKAA